MENKAYFLIDDERDLQRTWPRIRAGNPDFIKTFLLFSRADGRGVEAGAQQQGLDPRVLKSIVAKAHRHGLRVTTHIETAADFRNAVLAGVDEITHLPMPELDGSADAAGYLIDASTARLTARRGITVVATAGIFERPQFGASAARLPKLRETQRANLRLLADAGVRIAIGSDGISGEQPMATALDEALYLRRNGFFDALTLLKLWTENTAATIFPERRLGQLRDGYEASFLVLDADPLLDFGNVRRISMRVKQGQMLATPINQTADGQTP
jgi:imidazolonepropionase-like amidohydrolase